MGNYSSVKKIMSSPVQVPAAKKFESVEKFRFLELSCDDTNNGFCFNNFYFPEEIVILILSYIDPKELLRASLVCKNWHNIIKSDTFWASIYQRKHNKKPKKLPWYVYYCHLTTNYFDKNLIKNGNGQEEYRHWKIVLNYGDAFRIENPPCGSDPLPPDVPEFNGETSCFATSYYECNKLQEISLESNRLIQLIFNKFKPHIYLSEWVAGRFDCGCVYHLWCKLYGLKCEKSRIAHKSSSCESDDSDEEMFDDTNDDVESEPLFVKQEQMQVEQWAGGTWSKVEMLVKDYPSGVKRIVFQHEGRDTQFWKGHYGSKMAGGVLKILFDSMEPLP